MDFFSLPVIRIWKWLAPAAHSKDGDSASSDCPVVCVLGLAVLPRSTCYCNRSSKLWPSGWSDLGLGMVLDDRQSLSFYCHLADFRRMHEHAIYQAKTSYALLSVEAVKHMLMIWFDSCLSFYVRCPYWTRSACRGKHVQCTICETLRPKRCAIQSDRPFVQTAADIHAQYAQTQSYSILAST